VFALTRRNTFISMGNHRSYYKNLTNQLWLLFKPISILTCQQFKLDPYQEIVPLILKKIQQFPHCPLPMQREWGADEIVYVGAGLPEHGVLLEEQLPHLM
jgi:hypothetical protein